MLWVSRQNRYVVGEVASGPQIIFKTLKIWHFPLFWGRAEAGKNVDLFALYLSFVLSSKGGSFSS